MSTHLRIPKGAVERLRKHLMAATTPASHRDSVRTKILALNQHLSGWCRYYQHTANATREFAKLNPVVFWRMAHWLGRKFRVTMPEVMRRYRRGTTRSPPAKPGCTSRPPSRRVRIVSAF